MKRHRSTHAAARLGACAVLCAASAAWLPARAFESDVHYGLTRWLALRAGFEEAQAEAIAVADQRYEGGRLEALELDLEYACTARFPEVARQAQREHYPAAKAVPASAAERAVVAGGDAARHALAELAKGLEGKEHLMLGRLGEALNPLQDSWSHQGVPSLPSFGGALACDATLAMGHPANRGGPDSHAADLTAPWKADTLEMARATYAELLRYPAIAGKPRKAAPWASIAASLPAFIDATTKTQKRAWFVAQGIADTNFLEGTSLPDGKDPGALQWSGLKFPAKPGSASMQYDAPADVRQFFDQLLGRWLGTERIEAVVAELGPVAKGAAAPAGVDGKSARELAARLALWKMHDHGTAAALAHAPAPLTPAQLKEVDRLARTPRALLPPMPLADAVLPLQPSGPAISPLLPYIVRALAANGGAQRMIAIARLRHAPYDTVGWIAERRGDRWVLVDMVAGVDL